MKLFSSLVIKISLLLGLQQVTHCLVQNKVLLLGWKIFFFIDAHAEFDKNYLFNFFAIRLKFFNYRWIWVVATCLEPNSVCFVSQFPTFFVASFRLSQICCWVNWERALFLLLDHSEPFHLLGLKYDFCCWVQRCFVKDFKMIFVIRLYKITNVKLNALWLDHAKFLCLISWNVLFARFTITGLYFIRILFFPLRLNILIFLPILGWKYSCKCS